MWHFLYSVGPHPVSSLHIYPLFFFAGTHGGCPSQAGDADSSRAPGLSSSLQRSVHVHRGALLLVPQWQCISSFVFYIKLTIWTICAFRVLNPRQWSLAKERSLKSWKCLPKVPKQGTAKRDGVISPQNYNLNDFYKSLFIFQLLDECHCWWTKESPRAHVANLYGRLRLILAFWEHQNFLC